MLPDHRVIAVHPLDPLLFSPFSWRKLLPFHRRRRFIHLSLRRRRRSHRSLFFGSFLRKDFSHGAEKEEP